MCLTRPHTVPRWSHKNGAPRAMSNLLRPHGIPPRAYQELNPGFTPLHSLQEPMPSRLGIFINTPKGMRRTFSGELAKALGVPSAWSEATRFTGNLLNSLMRMHDNVMRNVTLRDCYKRKINEGLLVC